MHAKCKYVCTHSCKQVGVCVCVFAISRFNVCLGDVHVPLWYLHTEFIHVLGGLCTGRS